MVARRTNKDLHEPELGSPDQQEDYDDDSDENDDDDEAEIDAIITTNMMSTDENDNLHSAAETYDVNDSDIMTDNEGSMHQCK